MRKIYKIVNIALIFTLIWTILCQEVAFSDDKIRVSLSSSQNNIDSFSAEFAYTCLNLLAREKLGDEYFEIYLQPYYFLWGCFEIWRTHGNVGAAMPKTEASSGIINRLSNARTKEEVMEIAKAVLENVKEKVGYGNIKWTESYSGDTLYFECKTDKGTVCANIGPDRELRIMEEWSALFRNHESSKWLTDAEKSMEELISEKVKRGDKKINVAVFGIGWNGYSVYTIGAIVLRFLKFKGQDLSEWELTIDAFDRSSRLFYEMGKYQGEGAESLPLEKYKEFLNPENVGKIKSRVRTHLVDLNDPRQRNLVSRQTWDVTMGTNIAPYLTCDYGVFRAFMSNTTRGFSILDGEKDLRRIIVMNEKVQDMLIIDNKDSMEEIMRKLEKEIQRKKDELTNMFYQILKPLSDGNIYPDRIKYLLEENKVEIFLVIGEIRKMRMKEELLNGNIVNYMYLTRSNSPDTALCYNVRDCLKAALARVGLETKEEKTKAGYHAYCVIVSGVGEIAVDVAVGQFKGIPEIVVAFNSEYKPKIENIVTDNTERQDVFLKRLFDTEVVFPGLRRRETLRAL